MQHLRWFLAATFFGLAGCAGSGASSSDPALRTYEQMQNDYRASAAKLVLPPSEAFPDRYDQDPEAKYVRGFGEERAREIWFCAWSRQWLAVRTTSPAEAAVALKELEAVRTTPYWARIHYTERDALDAVVKAARAGDPLPLADEVKLNCRPAVRS
jgi:hypothetical protein